MSRRDFSVAEFADRRARVRAALREADLDWLIAIHPISIHWLTGSEAKSYQEFQCLIVSAHSDTLVILAREGERNELLDLMRKSKGRRSNLTAKEQDRVVKLLDKIRREGR